MIYLVEENTSKRQAVGEISKKVLDALGLSISNRIVTISPRAIKHVKDDHTKDFEKYFTELPDILLNPNYTGFKGHTKDKIEVVKKIDQFVLVGINISYDSSLSVSSFYQVNWVRIDTRHRRGRLIKLTD